MRRLAGLILLGALFGVIVACEGQPSTASYEQQILQDRVQRDMQMRGKGSVIPAQLRSSFQGLNYYPVDSTYRYVVPLQRAAQPDTVLIAESTGGVAEHVTIGRVAIPLPEGTAELVVFESQNQAAQGRLWIPFADATNGEATYKAGRYVDVKPARGGSVVVDFNRAYNPTCAYNPRYACPLPPEENHLAQPVAAGEKEPVLSKSG